MASVLSKKGYDTRVVDFRFEKEDILKILLRLDPLLVGFSIIFQHHIFKFKELICFLRDGGVKCHFTAGGLYVSLRYEELLKLIPSLDSVVNFEGEYTLLDLVNKINTQADWKRVRSIAFKVKGEIITNSLRPFEKDLDKFPFPCARLSQTMHW